ncbi:unnamed protein product [Adineta steineri]|uniref:LYR motif-containing protein 2 n=1 Tax=Adineta steineri TaxID=433720 RepID=A0A815KNC5_9BILA|nr:unnamed protein product [Adineta steineri]CAF1137268.1 unnamed protein product [Adineta steineri]CAF1277318.1 unnamed protein product [Adineta steineri]CAF1287188.1 unnamed protein product [Adineta steineri]CAF1395855.1 unnamed protein product [Adineta steineri]
MKQLSLKHFIIRSQAIALYRDIMRTLLKIQDQDYRKEMRDWARIEFNRHRTLKDLGEIRTQIALGRRNLNELKLSMQMAS